MISRRPPSMSLSFLVWVLLGAAICGALLLAAIVGVIAALAIVALATLLVSSRRLRFSPGGLLTGLGLLVLGVSYLNRHGPGSVCTTTHSGHSCVDELSPWPWLIVGLVLVVGGVGLFARSRRVTKLAGSSRSSG